jgi:uncharacterized protein YecE (DUF72 family)
VKVWLGTSGFSYGHWVGRFYPPDLPRHGWLEYYAKYFDTVELNVTFYRLPTERALTAWYRRTPSHFIFALKGNRLITHQKKLRGVEGLIRRFYQLADMLKEKRGPILWQLPPSLRKDVDLLSSFLNQLNPKYENVIEFRHISWFCDEIYELLNRFSVGYCIVSCPDFPTHLQVTVPWAYIRWHGLGNWYRYDYTRRELERWAEQIRQLKAERVYGYFNNDYNAWAPKNCLELKTLTK